MAKKAKPKDPALLVSQLASAVAILEAAEDVALAIGERDARRVISRCCMELLAVGRSLNKDFD